MSYLESNFCRRSEFDGSKEERILEEELHVDGKTAYLAHFLLRTVSPAVGTAQEAVKFPVSVSSRTRSNLGTYNLALTLLFMDENKNLYPGGTTIARSFDGFVNDTKPQVVIPDTESVMKYAVGLGYLKLYKEPATPEEPAIPMSLPIEARELVCV